MSCIQNILGVLGIFVAVIYLVGFTEELHIHIGEFWANLLCYDFGQGFKYVRFVFFVSIFLGGLVLHEYYNTRKGLVWFFGD